MTNSYYTKSTYREGLQLMLQTNNRVWLNDNWEKLLEDEIPTSYTIWGGGAAQSAYGTVRALILNTPLKNKSGMKAVSLATSRAVRSNAFKNASPEVQRMLKEWNAKTGSCKAQTTVLSDLLEKYRERLDDLGVDTTLIPDEMLRGGKGSMNKAPIRFTCCGKIEQRRIVGIAKSIEENTLSCSDCSVATGELERHCVTAARSFGMFVPGVRSSTQLRMNGLENKPFDLAIVAANGQVTLFEIDGAQHYEPWNGSPAAARAFANKLVSDREKTLKAKAMGFNLVRFDARDVKEPTDEMLEMLKIAALGKIAKQYTVIGVEAPGASNAHEDNPSAEKGQEWQTKRRGSKAVIAEMKASALSA